MNNSCPNCRLQLPVKDILLLKNTVHCKNCDKDCERFLPTIKVVASFLMIWVFVVCVYLWIKTPSIYIALLFLFVTNILILLSTPITLRSATSNKKRFLRIALILFLFIITMAEVKIVKEHGHSGGWQGAVAFGTIGGVVGTFAPEFGGAVESNFGEGNAIAAGPGGLSVIGNITYEILN